ncbi:DUF2625 family protein [Kribbella sp. DT2]|uniref:DUF2625 family protein n=1 Tax=Kribbella sp. DT2 TaxID=3393427 RepID=UPI003CEEE1D0
MNATESAWPWVLEQITESPVRVELLPPDGPAGSATLAQLQVTERSALGATVVNCGGLLVDGGWVRALGGSSIPGLGIGRVNEFPATTDPSWEPLNGLIIGYDVLGGVFAISTYDAATTGRPGEIGQVGYFAPDTLEWESLEITHSQWMDWLLSGGTNKFYESLRWPGWQDESDALLPTHGIAVYPFLWSTEARSDLPATSRRPVPMTELVGVATDFTAQIGLPSPGFLGNYS